MWISEGKSTFIGVLGGGKVLISHKAQQQPKDDHTEWCQNRYIAK